MHIKAYVKEATLDLCRKIQLSVRVVEQEIFMSASQRARAVERTFSFVCESISVPALFLYSNVRLFQVHFQTTLNYWFFIHHASSHWQNCFTHKSRGNWRNYWGLKKIIFQCTFLKSVNAAPSIVSPSCLLKEIGRVFFFSEWLSLGKGTLEFRRRAFVTLLLPLMSFWHCCIAELSFFFLLLSLLKLLLSCMLRHTIDRRALTPVTNAATAWAQVRAAEVNWAWNAPNKSALQCNQLLQ